MTLFRWNSATSLCTVSNSSISGATFVQKKKKTFKHPRTFPHHHVHSCQHHCYHHPQLYSLVFAKAHCKFYHIKRMFVMLNVNVDIFPQTWSYMNIFKMNMWYVSIIIPITVHKNQHYYNRDYFLFSAKRGAHPTAKIQLQRSSQWHCHRV